MADEIENLDSLNEEIENDDSTNVEEPASDDVEALKEQNKQLFARAKKAEGFELKDGKWLKPPKPEVKPEIKPEVKREENLATSDLYALMQAQVPQEDIQEVSDYAKLKGVSIAEALKSNVVRTILSDKAEERKAADAANVKPSGRQVSKPSSESLLDKVKTTGELPESKEDLEKLIALRIQKKKDAIKH